MSTTEQKLETPEKTDEDSQLSEPQGGTEPEKPARGLKGSGLRYAETDGVPTWAVGKTSDEMLEMTQTLYNTVMAGGNAGVPQAAPVQSVAPPPIETQVNNGQLSPPDPNLLYTQPEEYNRQLNIWNNATTQQQFEIASAPYLAGQVEMAKAEAKRTPANEEVWKRYAPEIEAEVANLSSAQKSSPKLWNDAAFLIAGRHQTDLFKDRIAREGGNDTGTLSTDGSLVSSGTPTSQMSPIQKAWHEDADWVQQFKRLPEMTLARLRTQVQKMGSTEEDYVKHYESRIAMRIHRADEEIAQYQGRLS